MKKTSKALVKKDQSDSLEHFNARPPEEKTQIMEWAEAYDAYIKKVPKYRLVETGETRKLAPCEDAILSHVQMAEILGTMDNDRTSHLSGQLSSLFWNMSDDQALNTALATLHDIAPKDSLEVLLAVQMLATHNVAIEMLRRALLTDQSFEGVDASVNRATKLLRTFTAQMEALNRHRGKGGEQRVIVQHVNVSDGGQAIVGNVTKHQGGREGKNENS